MRLLADPDVLVRRIAANNSTTVPGAALARLVLDHGEDSSYRPLLVEHPNFPVGWMWGVLDGVEDGGDRLGWGG